MKLLSLPLVALALLVLPPASSVAYQPPVVVPGGSWTSVVTCRNDSSAVRTITARARLRSHPFWSPPSQVRIQGPWAEIPSVTLDPGESRELEVELEVPGRAAGALDVEFRGPPGIAWSSDARWSLPLVEAESPAGPAGIPFRLVAGGSAVYDPDPEARDLVLEAVREDAAWDALRARLGVISPDSWDLYPDEGDGQAPFDGQNAHFAAAAAPDLATETLLALRTPEHGAHLWSRGLWIRSVAERADGTVVCRYSWRTRRVRGIVQGVWIPGDYLLAAIPATDAPVEFRRVP
jgi:hypothetical protein